MYIDVSSGISSIHGLRVEGTKTCRGKVFGIAVSQPLLALEDFSAARSLCGESPSLAVQFVACVMVVRTLFVPLRAKTTRKLCRRRSPRIGRSSCAYPHVFQPVCRRPLATRMALPEFTDLNEQAIVGDVAAAEATFRSLEPVFKTLPRQRQRVGINTVIKACANAGDYARAEIWFEEFKVRQLEPTEKSYGKVIEACAKAGKADLAEKWLHVAEDSGNSSGHVLYSILLDAFAKAADTDASMRWLDTLAARGIDVDHKTIGSLITSFSQKGDACGAERLLNQALNHPTLPVALEHFNAVITAWGRRRRLEDAERVFTRMTTALHLEANVVSYSALIDAHSRSGQPHKAEFWYDQLHNAGLQPNLITSRSLLSAHARASDVTRATGIFQAIRKQRLDPGLIGYTAMAKALINIGDLPQAEKIIHSMEVNRTSPDGVLCGTLVHGYAQLGDLQACQRWFGRTPVAEVGVPIYTQMLCAISNADISQTEAASKAVTVFRKMVQQSLQPNALTLTRFKDIVGRKQAEVEGKQLGVDMFIPKNWREDFDKDMQQRTVYRTQHKHTEKSLEFEEFRQSTGSVFHKPSNMQ